MFAEEALMKAEYSLYDAAGRVVEGGQNHLENVVVPEGLTLLVGTHADADAEYIAGGEAVERPEMPLQVAGTSVTAPAGVLYRLWSDEGVVAEGVSQTGVMRFDSVVPGRYELRLELFPYLDAGTPLSI